MGDRWRLIGREDAVGEIDQLLANPGPGILIVTGPAGVGRSRIAAQAHMVAAELNPEVELRSIRVLGTRAASRIPLGAFVSVLGDLGTGPNQLALARARLLGDAEGTALLLIVDDAHLLDDVSATLLLSLADHPGVRILATTPTGASCPDAITALWKDLGGNHLELEPLDRTEVSELLESVLEGPITSSGTDAFVEASGGLLLNLRELVESARRAGRLVCTDGVWDVTGDLTPGDRLSDLITERLGRLDPSAHRAVQALALTQPIPVTLLETVCGPEVANTLESQGIVEVHRREPYVTDGPSPIDGDTPEMRGLGRTTLSDARPDDVQLRNPLYGEAALAQATDAERNSLLAACADALECGTVTRPDDLLRVALWRLRSGGEAQPSKLLAAAHRAYRLADYPRVRELTEAAWALEPSDDAGHLLGFALGRAGECEAAEAILAKAETLASDDRMRTFVALARAENLQRGLGDVAGAIQICEQAEALLVADAWRDEVRAHRGMILLQRGDLLAARDLLDPIISQGPEVAPRAFVKAAYAQELVLAHFCRFDDVMALSQQALPVHEAVWEADFFQTEPAVHHLSTLIALSMTGRLLEADLIGQLALDLTRRGNPRYAFAWMSYLVGSNDLLRGRVATARHHFLDAVPIFRESRQEMTARWCLAGAATCSAALGETDAAAAHLKAANRLENPDIRMNQGQIADATGWVLYTNGEPDDARKFFDAEADRALGDGDLMNAARLLHSLVRCGGAETAVDRLDNLEGSTDGDLVAAITAFTHAIVDHDAAGCEAAADRFEAMGALLAGAEAAAEAARNFARDGQRRQASASDHRRSVLLEQCEGAVTPLTWGTLAPTPLSRREREVAHLAADGLSSKQIAERLSISHRTVDNHLQRIFVKLGVTGRAELDDALAG